MIGGKPARPTSSSRAEAGPQTIARAGGRSRSNQKGNDRVMAENRKPRILVVEDDPDLRTILRLQLLSQDWEVTETTNGAEGFAAIKEQTPDCVILDLMMPVMDGFGFLKRVRSMMELQDVPILILTASEDERNKIRGFQYQANAYMSKPYDLDELTAAVKRLLAFEQVS